MAGQPTFNRAKRFTYLHTAHKSIYDGTETKHVKSNLTASVEGNYTVTADKIYFQNPVVFQSTASLDGNIALGGNLTIAGNLAVTGSMIVTSSVLHKGDNIFGDQDADNHKFFGTTTASGGVFVAGSIIGQANASIDGNLVVGGNITGPKITLTSSLLANANASIDGTLVVGGNISGPKITLTSSLLANANASIDGNLVVGGEAKITSSIVGQANASIDGTLAIGGNITAPAITLTSSLLANANASIDGTLAVGGNISGPKITLTSSLLANANASIDGNLVIGGNNSVTGKNTVTSSIIGQANASIDGNLAIGGLTTLTGSILVDKNASIDGTLAVGGTTTLGGQLDMGQNKIINVENVVRSVKKTVAYSDFTATSRKYPQSITIFRASPGDSVIGTTWNLSANFAVASLMGTGLKAVRRTLLAIGDLGATGGFRRTTALATDTGWNMNENTSVYSGLYLQSVHASPLRKNYTAATLVKADFRASAAMLASLDQGSIDIYIDVLSRS